MTKAIINGAVDEIPAIRNLQLRAPADGRVTQPFGVRSITGTLHRGIDLGIIEGTPVRAASAGTVLTTRTGSWPWHGPLPPDYRGVDTSHGGYGNYVVVDHGGYDDRAGARWLLTSLYAHLSQVLVTAGQRLPAGAVLGRSGSTGISTGDHLHWEIRRNADPFDADEYLVEEEPMMDYPVALGQRTVEIPGSEDGKPFRRYVTMREIGLPAVVARARVRVVLQLSGVHPGSFAATHPAAANSLCSTPVQTACAVRPDGEGEVLLDERGGLFIIGQSRPLQRRRITVPPRPLQAILTVFGQEQAA